jgi:hypothetical protein
MTLRFICLLLLWATSGTYAQYRPIDEGGLLELYVSPTGDDANNGQAATPFRTFRKAIGTALYHKKNGRGCKVRVAPGTYRENQSENYAIQVSTPVATATSAPLVIEGMGWNPANPRNTGDVVLSGSEAFGGGWAKNPDGTWSKAWSYSFGVPKKSQPFGVADAFLRREGLFVNGQPFYHVNPHGYTNQNGTVGAQGEGEVAATFNRLTDAEGVFWVEDAVLKDGAVEKPGRITVKLPATYPANFDLNAPEQTVEVITRKGVLLCWLGSLATIPTNLVLRNLTFQHGGLQVKVQHQNNLLIEDCRFVQHKRIALTVSECRNVLLRRVECSDNGEGGATLNGVTNAEVVDCRFSNNCRQAEVLGYFSWSVAGIKFYTTKGDNRNIVLRRCQASRNRGTGFWWDTGNVLCQMIDCKGTHNSTNGTFIECNNAPENNFENIEKEHRENTGIPGLGLLPTVVAHRCVFAHNSPPAETKAYRKPKGRGVFFSENENAELHNCLIFDNDIQISTYDNRRGENKRFAFSHNLIAAQTEGQRLYAVGGGWDSREVFDVPVFNGPLLKIKGGWYGLFDGLDSRTNGNLYFSPALKAFHARSQRFGTEKWAKDPANTQPAYTLAEWQAAHLANEHNPSPDRRVDARSVQQVGAYDPAKPLIVLERDTTLSLAGSYERQYVSVSRVTDERLNTPFRVSYRILTWPKTNPNVPGKTVVSEVLTIPAWKTTIPMQLDTKALLEQGDVGRVAIEIDSVSQTYYTTTPRCVVELSQIEAERVARGLDKPSDPTQPLHTSRAQGFALTVRLRNAVKKVRLESQAGLDIPLKTTVQANEHTFTPILPLTSGNYELKVKTEAENLTFRVNVN